MHCARYDAFNYDFIHYFVSFTLFTKFRSGIERNETCVVLPALMILVFAHFSAAFFFFLFSSYSEYKFHWIRFIIENRIKRTPTLKCRGIIYGVDTLHIGLSRSDEWNSSLKNLFIAFSNNKFSVVDQLNTEHLSNLLKQATKKKQSVI